MATSRDIQQQLLASFASEQLLASFASEQARDAALESMPKVYVQRLADPYPPREEWVAESAEIKNRWQSTLSHRDLADNRVKRKDVIHLLEPDRLQHTAESHQSVIYIDADTDELVGFVVRKFTSNAGVLGWLDDRAIAVSDEERSVRRDDPGTGPQIGYTAGPLSQADFRWLKSTNKRPAAWLRDYDRQNSSACAFIWNKAKSVFPPSIIDNIESTLAEEGLPRMDRLDCDGDLKASEFSRYHPRQGFYEVHVGAKRVSLKGDYAPPAAFVGSNYARFTHNERNAHDWCIQLTTHRSVPSTPAQGGHFYIASYGIRIMADTDSAGAWKSTDFHGTTLQCKDPVYGVDDGPYQQRGFSILTGTRLVQAWKKGKVKAGAASE